MRFGPVPVDQALGAILAHTMMPGGRRLGKGHVLTGDDITALRSAGVQSVVVATLGADDVGEDVAAARLAAALVPDGGMAGIGLSKPHAGRVNLIATRAGIVALDADAIHRLNRIDPSVTLATLPVHQRVTPGTMVGTVKIIAYAVAETALAAACTAAQAAIVVHPVTCRSAGLILTRASGPDAKLATKAREAIARRLTRLGMELAEVIRVPHTIPDLSVALGNLQGDMLLILTGAATSDMHDTAPEALRQAGGVVARFGMPVDPGNLLFHGTLGGRPVIGLPGCARSPALNGADCVLERMACGMVISDDDVAGMGVGGLLKEIPLRPEPRERPQRG